MPVERAVAQLFAVRFAGTKRDTPFVSRMRARGWGVVVLDRSNVTTPDDTAALLRSIARAAPAAGGVAPLLAAAPGTLGDRPVPEPEQASAAEARAAALRAGRALRAAGVRLALAPDADLGIVAGPAEQTAFSDQRPAVSALTAAAVAGYRAAGVAAAPGHFPGQGGASHDP